MSVIIYTRTTCAPCRTVKYFLQKKGIAFTEKNVDDPVMAAEFAQLSTLPMVPLILVGDKKIQGLNLALLARTLAI